MKRLINCLINNYYIIVIALYLATFYNSNISVGVICSALICVTIVGSFVFNRIDIYRMSFTDTICLIYFFWCMGSSIQYIVQELPISVFVKAVSNSLLPVFFYYFARKKSINKFWNRFVFAYCVCGGVGAVLLVTMPKWFWTYCYNHGYSYTRLSSAVGSTAMGCLGAIAVVVCLEKVYRTCGRQGKILYVLSLLFTFMSMQRSAWMVSFLSLIILHYCFFVKWRRVKRKYLLVEFAFLISVFLVCQEQLISMIKRWVLEHQDSAINNPGGAGLFSSRVGQWIDGFQNSNIFWGSGYGARSHKAVGYISYAVCDGSWSVLVCEIGMIGCILFLVIIIRSLKFGVYNFKELFMPVMVIVTISLQAIGSNMFEYQIIMPLFWMAVGQIERYRCQKGKVEYESDSYVSSTIS